MNNRQAGNAVEATDRDDGLYATSAWKIMTAKTTRIGDSQADESAASLSTIDTERQRANAAELRAAELVELLGVAEQECRDLRLRCQKYGITGEVIVVNASSTCDSDRNVRDTAASKTACLTENSRTEEARLRDQVRALEREAADHHSHLASVEAKLAEANARVVNAARLEAKSLADILSHHRAVFAARCKETTEPQLRSVILEVLDDVDRWLADAITAGGGRDPRQDMEISRSKDDTNGILDGGRHGEADACCHRDNFRACGMGPLGVIGRLQAETSSLRSRYEYSVQEQRRLHIELTNPVSVTCTACGTETQAPRCTGVGRPLPPKDVACGDTEVHCLTRSTATPQSLMQDVSPCSPRSSSTAPAGCRWPRTISTTPRSGVGAEADDGVAVQGPFDELRSPSVQSWRVGRAKEQVTPEPLRDHLKARPQQGLQSGLTLPSPAPISPRKVPSTARGASTPMQVVRQIRRKMTEDYEFRSPRLLTLVHRHPAPEEDPPKLMELRERFFKS
eukprot:TRINITY_DN16525_c0_g1_i1.p1 TRINITY_DN16525_c0_g1~~TRINITY_DN16525_c0_g1_i1.p1  ORF type:complete len:510 (-),score=90.50 TRINITY_DN16525_c0_g1_i1:104-1633(-)